MLLSGGTDTLADSGAAEAAVARLRANGTIFRRVVVASAEWLPQKGAKMTELRIDAGKAERIITQILRDEKGIPPADAVAVAVSICLRLAAAMPTSPSLDRYRIIPREPHPATISRLQWQKSSLKRTVSFGTRAFFGFKGSDLRAS